MNINDLDNNSLFKYNYNKKVFYGYHQNGNIYMAALYKNDIINKFSNDEIYVMRAVINSLIVNRNKSFIVNTLNIQGENYDIFYDPVKRLYFWDSDNTTQMEFINQALNFRYNNIKDYIYIDFWKMLQKDSQKEQKHFKREIFIEKLGKTINVLVSSTLSLTLLLSLSVLVYKTVNIIGDATSQTSGVVIEKIVEITEEMPHVSEYAENSKDNLYDSEIYSWNEIEFLIDNNSNLSDEDKNMIKKLRFVFDEYNQYMDLSLIKSRLSNLNIVLCNSSESQCKSENAEGCYWSNKNTIELFSNKNRINKELKFIHEFLHVLQKANYGGPNIFMELSNTFFSVEILQRLIENNEINTDFEFGTDLAGYDSLLKYYFYLANLMPLESRCKFQFDPDIRVFANSLSPNTAEYGHIFTISDLIYDLTKTVDGADYSVIENKIMEKIDAFYMNRLGITTKDDIDSLIMSDVLYKKEYLKVMSEKLGKFILNHDDNKPNWFGTGDYDDIYLGSSYIKKMFEKNSNSKISYVLLQTGKALPINSDPYDRIYEFNNSAKNKYFEYIKINTIKDGVTQISPNGTDHIVVDEKGDEIDF